MKNLQKKKQFHQWNITNNVCNKLRHTGHAWGDKMQILKKNQESFAFCLRITSHDIKTCKFLITIRELKPPNKITSNMIVIHYKPDFFLLIFCQRHYHINGTNFMCFFCWKYPKNFPLRLTTLELQNTNYNLMNKK